MVAGGDTAYSPPPRPPRSTPTAAVRGEPCAPARASGRERTCRGPAQNAEKEKRPEMHLQPLRGSVRALERVAAAGQPTDTASSGDPCFFELPHWDPRTTFSRARRCPCHCTKRAQGEGRLK